MIQITTRGGVLRKRMKDPHTMQLYEEAKMHRLALAASDAITACGTPENKAADFSRVGALRRNIYFQI